MAFEVVTLPNILESAESLKFVINPNYEEFSKDYGKFILKYGGKYSESFLAESRAFFYAVTSPTASAERLHVFADCIDADWFYDEVAEDEPEIVEELGNYLIKILDGENVESDNMICKALKDSSDRLKLYTSSHEYDQWTKVYKELLRSHITEIKRRREGKFLSINEFMKERKINSGVCFFMTTAMISEQLQISKELSENETFQKAQEAFYNFIWAANDIWSFKKEYYKGSHDMNIVGALLHERKCSFKEAFDEAGRICRELINVYMMERGKLLETYSDSNTLRILKFCDANIAGIIKWYRITKRYSENEEAMEENLKIKITRKN